MALTKDEILLELQAARSDAGPSSEPMRLRFADHFDDLSFGECRRSHAEEALRAPRALTAYDVGGKRVVVATSVVAPARKRPFALVVFAGEESAGTYQVLAGWRIFADEGASLDELADDPTLALATFLDRYALAYEAGGISSRFSSLLLEPATPDGSLTFLSSTARTERGAVNAFVKTMADHVEIAWPFVLNGDAYLADMRAR